MAGHVEQLGQMDGQKAQEGKTGFGMNTVSLLTLSTIGKKDAKFAGQILLLACIQYNLYIVLKLSVMFPFSAQFGLYNRLYLASYFLSVCQNKSLPHG